MYQPRNTVPRSNVSVFASNEPTESELAQLLREKRRHRRAGKSKESFASDLGKHLVYTLIGLLCTLILTGIGSSISLYFRVSGLADAQTRTETSLQRHLDNAVDLTEYRRRDQALQKMIDTKASKEEVTEIRTQLDHALDKMATKDDVREQMRTLQSIQETILTRTSRRDR